VSNSQFKGAVSNAVYMFVICIFSERQVGSSCVGIKDAPIRHWLSPNNRSITD